MASADISKGEQDRIYLRGFHYVDGNAYVESGGPSPIEGLPFGVPPNPICQGYVHTGEDGVRTAVYALDGRLFLQIEERQWDWEGDGVRIDLDKDRSGGGARWRQWRNHVSVCAGGELQYENVYVPPVVEHLEFRDVLFADLDELMEDWWFWLHHNLAGSQDVRLLAERWQKGLEPWRPGLHDRRLLLNRMPSRPRDGVAVPAIFLLGTIACLVGATPLVAQFLRRALQSGSAGVKEWLLAAWALCSVAGAAGFCYLCGRWVWRCVVDTRLASLIELLPIGVRLRRTDRVLRWQDVRRTEVTKSRGLSSRLRLVFADGTEALVPSHYGVFETLVAHGELTGRYDILYAWAVPEYRLTRRRIFKIAAVCGAFALCLVATWVGSGLLMGWEDTGPVWGACVLLAAVWFGLLGLVAVFIKLMRARGRVWLCRDCVCAEFGFVRDSRGRCFSEVAARDIAGATLIRQPGPEGHLLLEITPKDPDKLRVRGVYCPTTADPGVLKAAFEAMGVTLNIK
jgi:hypothetical protein